MLARVDSYVLTGIDAILCEVEVNVDKSGMDRTTVVGLAQAAMKESSERVYQAIENSGYPIKARKVLVNLAPADVRKEGPSLDLPIAVGLLRTTGFIEGDKHRDYLVAGELALDGRVRRIKGGLSLAMLARQQGRRGVIVPAENARECSVVEGIDVIGVAMLQQVASFLNGTLVIEPHELNGEPYAASQLGPDLDFVDVRGQESTKRAITIACAGGHNCLMVGPPGTGVPDYIAVFNADEPPAHSRDRVEREHVGRLNAAEPVSHRHSRTVEALAALLQGSGASSRSETQTGHLASGIAKLKERRPLTPLADEDAASPDQHAQSDHRRSAIATRCPERLRAHPVHAAGQLDHYAQPEPLPKRPHYRLVRRRRRGRLHSLHKSQQPDRQL